MIVVGWVLGVRSSGVLQEVNGSIINALGVIGLAKGVGGVRKIRQAAARGLCEGKRYIEVTAVLKHQIGKVVCGWCVIGLNLEGPLAEVFSILPVAARLEKRF